MPFLILAFLIFSQWAYGQIYDATREYPSITYLQACTQEEISELYTFLQSASCAPEQNIGRFPKVTVYADGCAASACAKCGTFDIYVGDGKCFRPPFHAVVTISNPEPRFCAANPIDVVTGKKIQKEIDIHPNRQGQVEFYRVYSNSQDSIGGRWYNPYQKQLRSITPSSSAYLKAKSTGYTTRKDACEQGFNQIKSQLNESWIQVATHALYSSDGSCDIVRQQGVSGDVVGRLQIVADGKEYADKSFAHAVQLVRENGSILEFNIIVVNGKHQYASFYGDSGTLTYVNHNAQVAWRYVSKAGEVEEYDKNGRLHSIISRNGLRQELFYDQFSGLLTRVKDSTSRELLFAYNGNQIRSVTIGGNITTSYSYNSLGLIQQVTRPDNTVRIYHYEDARFPTYLTGITDERGIRYATWSYSSQGLAIFSAHAGGADKTQLSFNSDGSTTITNALNGSINYNIQKDISGVKQVVSTTVLPTGNIEGATTKYNYYYGRPGCVIDPKGIASKCLSWGRFYEVVQDRTYLDKNFQTYYLKSYKWHTEKTHLITHIMEGNFEEAGRITRFDYDDRGYLLRKNISEISSIPYNW